MVKHTEKLAILLSLALITMSLTACAGNKITAIPTPTETPTSTLTESVTPTLTDAPVVTEEPFITEAPSITEEPEVTTEPTKVPTSLPTNIPTDVVVPTEEATPTDVVTPTETLEPTNSAEPTEAVVPTETVTPTIEVTPTETVEPTITEVPVVTITPAITEQPVLTTAPTATVAPTATAVPTKAPTSTVAPTAVPTSTPTKAPTGTAVPTKAPIVTEKPAATATPTAVPTKTPTSTPTVAPTKTPTSTPVPTKAPTITFIATPTLEPTCTPIIDIPITQTIILGPTATPTLSPTPYIVIDDEWSTCWSDGTIIYKERHPSPTPSATPTPTPKPEDFTGSIGFNITGSMDDKQCVKKVIAVDENGVPYWKSRTLNNVDGVNSIYKGIDLDDSSTWINVTLYDDTSWPFNEWNQYILEHYTIEEIYNANRNETYVPLTYQEQIAKIQAMITEAFNETAFDFLVDFGMIMARDLAAPAMGYSPIGKYETLVDVCLHETKERIIEVLFKGTENSRVKYHDGILAPKIFRGTFQDGDEWKDYYFTGCLNQEEYWFEYLPATHYFDSESLPANDITRIVYKDKETLYSWFDRLYDAIRSEIITKEDVIW